ncbi:glycosyltransferase family 4 protein [Ahrensia kielensis]|uniref:Glycosyltransferase family 4 protein n=1 Tax=Ahrensia kielensis TaxID=76980 RepID=A0ABU9T809_9HYPH
MGKTIWIINQYGSTPNIGIGGRHFYLSMALAKRGHTVKVICASSHHLLRQYPDVKSDLLEQKIGNVSYIWLKMPRYGGASDKKRIWNWFKFAAKLPSLHNKIGSKPDVILCSSPSLVSFLGAEILARKTGARIVSEVRDIWPMTLIELGGYSINHPFIRLLQMVEDRVYRKSDAVISNLKYAVTHMTSRGMDEKKFHWIPNGFSEEEFNIDEIFVKNFKALLPDDKLILGYAGTMGRANDLDTIIDAAALLQDRTDVAFVLVGDGDLKEALVNKTKALKLANIHFYASVPKGKVSSVLDTFDACLLCWHNSPLYIYGVAANKLYEYLASGKPLLQSYSGTGDLVNEYEAGITVDAQRPDMLANAIRQFSELSLNQRKKLGSNGRKAAYENYEYNILGQKLEHVLLHKRFD